MEMIFVFEIQISPLHLYDNSRYFIYNRGFSIVFDETVVKHIISKVSL